MTPPRPQPDRDVAPTVARVRLRYAKRGRMRFASHRDFQRSFERAIRRAAVPISYSAGFTPHPRISYVNAAPTGTGSEAEYLEIGLTRVVDSDALARDLGACMADGFVVLEAVEARTPDFAERMQASVWEIRVAAAPETVVPAISSLLAAEHVEVERLVKGGMRRFDARPALLHLEVVDGPPIELGMDTGGAATQRAPGGDVPCAILHAVVRHETPAVRPDDVLAALRHVSGLAPAVPPQVTRLAQGPLVADARQVLASVGDPLGPDRAALRPD